MILIGLALISLFAAESQREQIQWQSKYGGIPEDYAESYACVSGTIFFVSFVNSIVTGSIGFCFIFIDKNMEYLLKGLNNYNSIEQLKRTKV